MAPGELCPDDVREHLRHITASAGFRNAGSIRRLLEFTVEKVLAGESSEIKEYTLGLDVFGRKESFDPRTDAIVRVQARKLRERLLTYYESEGARETFRIEYPKGSYIPQIAAPQPSGAYQFYLKGRHFWNQRTEHGLRRAIECYQAAVEDEPRFARAWAAMAETYQLIAAHSLDAPDSCLRTARRAAETALSLDPGLAAAHSAMASIHITYDRNPAAAQLEWERALEIDPNCAYGWHVLGVFGYALGGLGSWDDAVAALRQAERLEPLSPAVACDFGFILYWGRHYAEAIEACHRALDLHPSFCRTYVPLARAHALLGDHEAAIRICLEARALFRGRAFFRVVAGHARLLLWPNGPHARSGECDRGTTANGPGTLRLRLRHCDRPRGHRGPRQDDGELAGGASGARLLADRFAHRTAVRFHARRAGVRAAQQGVWPTPVIGPPSLQKSTIFLISATLLSASRVRLLSIPSRMVHHYRTGPRGFKSGDARVGFQQRFEPLLPGGAARVSRGWEKS